MTNAYEPKTFEADQDWFALNLNWKMPHGRYEIQVSLDLETLERSFTFRRLDPIPYPQFWTVGVLKDGVTVEDVARQAKERIRDRWNEWEPQA